MRRLRPLGIAIFLTAALSACSALGFPGGGFGSGPSSQMPPFHSGPDTKAQSLLAGAWASVMSTSNGRFDQVTKASIAATDPTLKVVGDVPARIDVISVDHTGSDGVVMSTKSSSGNVFCIAVTSDPIPITGSVDAHRAASVHDCSGKPWGPS
jgi:hypothetical protein